ncbi:tetratricopeptide repeat-containing sensor histidine kinase [Flavivirga sp. 57AJ16]|uniref:ATP-binding protein n=1 Tax=Flavivirga sp. 57AJ16 TaxID=3025307 RepID=UPI002366FBE3|nr:tetratricopeptide repeat-containing sensor histidine kinase [Flavivirga sp. 57AJ16]MDD7886901.1 tetratricopeptide repeat-containing sensor histidine kinase [Flavivirga sp. 57AJ16]
MHRLSLKKQYLFLLGGMYSFILFGIEKQAIVRIDQELKKQCYHCSASTTFYNDKDTYHGLHIAFSSNNIDRAFALCNELLRRNIIKKPEAKFWLYTIKGRILKEKKLYPLAIKAISKAIEIGHANEILYVKESYATQGQLYYELKEFHKAVTVLEQWRSVHNKNDINWNVNLHNLGICYLHLKSYAKASESLQESLAINQKRGDTLNMAKSAMDIGNLYYVQYLDSIAIPYFKKGLEYAKKAKDLKTLRNAYLNMAIVEENRKRFKKALEYRKEAEKVKDSIWNRDKIWQLAEKDKELTVRLNEEKLAKERLKRHGAFVITFFSLAGIVLVLFLGIKLRKKNRKITFQKKKVDALNTTKDKLLTILSHDLKTPVYFLSNKLLALSTKDSKEQRYLDKEIQACYSIASNTSLLIENTLQWALNNRNKLLFKLTVIHLETMIDQVLYYFKPVIALKKLNLNIQIPEFCTVTGDNNTLKIIFRNIFDNAVKYTPEERAITITAKEDNESILLIIENPVLDKKTSSNVSGPFNSTGLGHQLCKEFAIKNGGVFEVFETSSYIQISLSLRKSHQDEYISV